MTIAFYSVVEHGDTRHEFKANGMTVSKSAAAIHLRWAAEDAASDYHSNHDGWESHWPLTFVIYESEAGPELARFSVDREAAPQFTAAHVSNPTDGG